MRHMPIRGVESGMRPMGRGARGLVLVGGTKEQSYGGIYLCA